MTSTITRQRLQAAGSRFGTFVLIALLLAVAATACSPAADTENDAARALQYQVLAVTESAASNDPTGTLKLLDELKAELDEAALAGDITFQRHQNIQAAIDALRAELTASAQPKPEQYAAAVPVPAAPAAETATAAAAAKKPSVLGTVARKPAAPAQPAPAPITAVAPVAPAPAPSVNNNGKAVGKDKGNGKG